MYDIRYSVYFNNKKEVFVEYINTKSIDFSFHCCNRYFEIEIENTEVGIYKGCCNICGNTAVVEIERVSNCDDPCYQNCLYLQKELEND